MVPVTYRETNRERLRDALVAAARDLTIGNGWDGVRMADVARAAGVSRQTVYNEFGDKSGLAEALAAREIDAFVADVRGALHRHGPDIRAAGRAAIGHTLLEAAGNPLIKAILTSARGSADELLPFLTTRSELLLAAATAVIGDWAGTHLPDHDPRVVAVAAESIVRLVVSHIVQPSQAPDRTADDLTDVLVRLLTP
ncbi:TetR/AcrR family transcriptional regulator [Dactylosporangium siamense]